MICLDLAQSASCQFSLGRSPDSPHRQVHMDRSTPYLGDGTWTGPCGLDYKWTRGGLEVDWKIVNLAGDSTSSPHPVLVHSWPSPRLVLVESSFSPDI